MECPQLFESMDLSTFYFKIGREKELTVNV